MLRFKDEGGELKKKIKIDPINNVYEDQFKQCLAHNCLFYIIPPLIEISLSEFESLAVDRLKLFRIFEQASVKYPKTLSPEWENYIKNELNIAGLKYFTRLFTGHSKTEQDMRARRNDYLSHFILQMAYCRNEELRQWFLAREMDIFKLKFSKLSKEAIKELIDVYEIGYRPISEEQKEKFRFNLQAGLSENIDDIDFYKVHFTAVIDLVRQRKCFLNAGYAYVNCKDLSYILGNHHHEFIEKNLFSHIRILPDIENDDRIVDIIKGLHTSYLGKDYTVPNREFGIALESLDQLSLKSYPLCMRACHDSLRSTHHLKYHGRLQYGLFLKGIGISMEESLQFWRDEFSKTMDSDKFDKAYGYGVRYNYGKEGSRTDWSPYSCMKVISTGAAAQDVSGCPFKLWDAVEMRKRLLSYGLNQVQIQDVVSYASKGHFQLACGRYFEITHNVALQEGINHPNGYFEQSQIFMGNRKEKQKPLQNSQMSQPQQRVEQAKLQRKLEIEKMEKEIDAVLWNLTERDQDDLLLFEAECAAMDKKNEEKSKENSSAAEIL